MSEEKKYREQECIDACIQRKFVFKNYNQRTKMVTFECKCKTIQTVEFDTLTRPTRKNNCNNCKNNNKRLTFETVKQIFEDGGCRLISEDYENAHQLLDYECSCKNISQIRINDFKDGVRCMNCRISRTKETRKKNGVLTVVQLRKLLSEKGCVGHTILNKAQLLEKLKEYD